MMMRRLLVVLVLALVSLGGIRTYAPSGPSAGIGGSSGPQADEYIPFGDPSIPPPLAYWGFNGTSTTYSTDPTYYGYDSKKIYFLPKAGSGPLPSTTSMNGRSVQIRTPGTSDYFTLTTTALRMSGSFSVSFWARGASGLPGDSDANQLVLVTSSLDWQVYLGLGSSNMTFAYIDSISGSSAVQGGPISTTYKHFVCVYRASTKDGLWYINAVPGAPGAALTNGLRQQSDSATIVAHNGTTGFFIIVDELTVFPSELSAANVTSLYNGGAGKFY